MGPHYKATPYCPVNRDEEISKGVAVKNQGIENLVLRIKRDLKIPNKKVNVARK